MSEMITEAIVKQELSGIADPDLGLTLYDLDAIKKVRIEGKLIEVFLELVQPIQWTVQKINDACVNVINSIAPGFDSEISFSEKPSNTSERQILKNIKNIIAVASGKGGVGKSAVTSNLAGALSLMGAKVGVLDGDVYGPSQPTMFGLEKQPINAVETPDGKVIAYPNEKFDIKIASMGFILQRDEAAIVRGPMLASYFSMLFEQIEWGPLDFLLFDLPPGTGDIQLTLTQKIPLTGAVIVTTPQEISLADVRRSIAMFQRVNVDILGIIENMSYFVPPDMPDKKYHIFGQGGGKTVAKENSIKLLGEVPLDIRMREGNDSGKPIVFENNAQAGVFKNIAATIVSEVRKLNYSKMESVETQISI
ncbi:MAG: Mrp/NBP35 family ATP-binding protein [Ignavibacteriae bacterium]|nr:Mrp/NBP35 family ATP-binding protein [Ignavibacteriota bacterium]